MTEPFAFQIKSHRFDEAYTPESGTRLTTNFANLARGEHRQQNLANALRMIDNRFNDLAGWDNPQADRYAVELDIVSVDLDLDGSGNAFPAIEVLQTTIHDRRTGARTPGLVGNNFSSYVRDYDFSVALPEHNKGRDSFGLPDDFGELHGKIFKAFVASDAFRARFSKPPVICLSVSETKSYERTANTHPVLGVEYVPSGTSLTEQYFGRMGLKVRYFMPVKSVAPLAFYHSGDLLNDHTNLELIGTISTMEAFQKIYRPEIYNANSVAGQHYRPSLKHQDFSPTRVIYDRDERACLATEQGRFAEETFIKPHHARLTERSARFAA